MNSENSTSGITPSNAMVASLGLSFFLNLERAHALILRRLDVRLATLHGLSFSDFMVLYALQQAPETRLRRVDLAQRMGLSASGATRTLLPLEKLGWITRLADARDARIAYAVLTESGAELLAYAMVSAEEIAGEILTPLKLGAKGEVAQFSSVLERMVGSA